MEKMNFRISLFLYSLGPIVGLHIRRTDKIQEAKYHNVTEYMNWAEHWFQIQEKHQNITLTRRIYVSTDDVSVIEEIEKE